MATYKYIDLLKQNDSVGFDSTFKPGEAAPNAGIYRCTGCHWEIGIARGHTLPPQDHHTHTGGEVPVLWQLVVFAVHKG